MGLSNNDVIPSEVRFNDFVASIHEPSNKVSRLKKWYRNKKCDFIYEGALKRIVFDLIRP
jgi:hypothetical protein